MLRLLPVHTRAAFCRRVVRHQLQSVPKARRLATASDAISQLNARELQKRLDELGVSSVGCLEKADLVARVRQAEQQVPEISTKKAVKPEASKGPVDIRDSSTLTRFLSGDGVRFVAWYARWCPLCMGVMPEYDLLALVHPSAQFARVDVDVLVADAERHGAERYGKRLPTFHAFVGEQQVGEMKGADPAALATFLHRKVRTHSR